MSDIIEILPDSVANQIAAGEVIQRPASVVKELMENAIDAGSTSMKIIIKDAGKSLIQIIDNGCGMSETDARIAFERHSTSKIRKAEDLFLIRTMGFRGEALASIAAVAQVDLKTKRVEDEIGTRISIKASEVICHEAVSCSNGSSFLIKNLFFNIPARRKFLKTNNTESRHIINEFQKIALANPDIAFSLFNTDVEIYNLLSSGLRQRIVSLFGKHINKQLINIETKTSIVNITGFVGKPEYAKKTSGEQFFFVNGRFMRHPYFHKAVMLGFEKIIQPETYPSYFIYLEVDPDTIDINIHPTKTEINFEDAPSIFQFIRVAINESMGKFNITRSFEFDQEGSINIPVASKTKEVNYPSVTVNPEYNPFETNSSGGSDRKSAPNQNEIEQWDKLLTDINNIAKQQEFDIENGTEKQIQHTNTENGFIQIKNKYILTKVKSGLMVVDQKRAHERILFENYLSSLNNSTVAVQQCLFPIVVELSSNDFQIVQEIKDNISALGFDLGEYGSNTIAINGVPADISMSDTDEIKTTFEKLIESYRQNTFTEKLSIKEKVAVSLAKSMSIGYGKVLSNSEMKLIIDGLFACQIPNYSPDGKKTVEIIQAEEFDKRF